MKFIWEEVDPATPSVMSLDANEPFISAPTNDASENSTAYDVSLPRDDGLSLRPLSDYERTEQESECTLEEEVTHSASGNHFQEVESLDYEAVVNTYSRDLLRGIIRGKRKTAVGYTGKTFARWVLAIFTGIVAGIFAYIIGHLTDALIETRKAAFFPTGFVPSPWNCASVTMWNLMLTLSASLGVLIVAPSAAGSGIPEVKAYLNGVHMQQFLSMKTLAVKVAGTIAGVASGMVMGPEGPLVHVGAIIGSGVTRGRKRVHLPCLGIDHSFKWAWGMQFRNDSDRRDFVSLGAAAGFSAAFGAPIGGVLFSLEEASSFWSQKLMWRALCCSLMATCTLCLLNYSPKDVDASFSFQHFGLISLRSNDQAQADSELNWNLIELLPYGALGVFGGLLGAAFNHVFLWFAQRRSKTKLGKLSEVALVSIFTSVVCYYLTMWQNWACIPALEFNFTLSSGEDPASVWRYNCEQGHVNELASVFWDNREVAIKHLIISPEQFSYNCLAAIFFVYTPLLCLTMGCALPCGLFMPCILIGSSFGAIFGKFMTDLNANTFENPGSFALMGAVAMLGGVQRSTISLCVIILEGTGKVDFLLPIMFTTVFARYIGDLCSHGIYETLLHIKGVPFLEREQHRNYPLYAVDEVMAHPVKTFQTVESVASLMEVLGTCEHNAFPVVLDNGSNVGLILRDQIQTLVRGRQFLAEERSASLCDSNSLRRSSDTQRLRSQTLVEDITVPRASFNVDFEADKHRFVDLSTAMNLAPCTVLDTCPLSRALALFTTMGLRHLVVTGHDNVVLGMITRKDLCVFEHERASGNKKWKERTFYVPEKPPPGHRFRGRSIADLKDIRSAVSSTGSRRHQKPKPAAAKQLGDVTRCPK